VNREPDTDTRKRDRNTRREYRRARDYKRQASPLWAFAVEPLVRHWHAMPEVRHD
jgi:hypothetical protein